MVNKVTQNNHPISMETRSLISTRYKTITKAVNGDFWNSYSDTAHSRYVGSYGRGTAINVSDLDVLIELPNNEYERFNSLSGNGQSRLLQAVKKAIQDTYPRTDVHGDGQVVVVTFSDGMKFEVLPAFQDLNLWISGMEHMFILTLIWEATGFLLIQRQNKMLWRAKTIIAMGFYLTLINTLELLERIIIQVIIYPEF